MNHSGLGDLKNSFQSCGLEISDWVQLGAFPPFFPTDLLYVDDHMFLSYGQAGLALS